MRESKVRQGLLIQNVERRICLKQCYLYRCLKLEQEALGIRKLVLDCNDDIFAVLLAGYCILFTRYRPLIISEMSLLEHSQYDNDQVSVLVVGPLEYMRTQLFECLKRLRAHFLHIDLALLVKLPLTSLNRICDKRTHRVTLSQLVSLPISLLSELVIKSATLE